MEPVEADEQFDVDNVVSMALLGAEGGNHAGAAGVARVVNPLEALLGPGGFPQLLDMPQAEDDEAMVELAIALSLQDHEGGPQMQALQQGFQQSLANLQGLEGLQNLSGQALQSLQALAAQGIGPVQGGAVAQVQIFIIS